MTSGHEGGYAFNEDQRGAHPDPFIFINPQDGEPYKAMRWGGGEWWFFYWHVSKRWVSLRKASPESLRELRPLALPPEQAKLYDDLHAKHETR